MMSAVLFCRALFLHINQSFFCWFLTPPPTTFLQTGLVSLWSIVPHCSFLYGNLVSVFLQRWLTVPLWPHLDCFFRLSGSFSFGMSLIWFHLSFQYSFPRGSPSVSFPVRRVWWSQSVSVLVHLTSFALPLPRTLYYLDLTLVPSLSHATCDNLLHL